MDNIKAWKDLVARYYGDAAFASEVDKDPTAMIRKHGITIPEGKTICFHKNNDDTINVVLPPNPSSEMNSEEMGSVFGGDSDLSWPSYG